MFPCRQLRRRRLRQLMTNSCLPAFPPFPPTTGRPLVKEEINRHHPTANGRAILQERSIKMIRPRDIRFFFYALIPNSLPSPSMEHRLRLGWAGREFSIKSRCIFFDSFHSGTPLSVFIRVHYDHFYCFPMLVSVAVAIMFHTEYLALLKFYRSHVPTLAHDRAFRSRLISSIAFREIDGELRASIRFLI